MFRTLYIRSYNRNEFFLLKKETCKKKLKHFPSQEPNTHKHVEASKAYTRKISSESQEGDIQWKAWKRIENF